MKKILFSILFLSTCWQWTMAQNSDFKTTPNGIRYKVFQRNPQAKIIQLGDVLEFKVKILNYKDSVLTDDLVKDVPAIPSRYKGDIVEVFGFLAKGDSTVCWVNVDSLSKSVGQEMPPFLPKGTDIKYIFKILNVKAKAEVEAEKKQALEAKKAQEGKVLTEYAQKNNLKTTTTSSGLQYAIVKSAVTGRRANKGEVVQVHYTGKLLNGKVFDSSVMEVAKANNIYTEGRDYAPFSFPLGEGQVIQGWEEGLTYINEGSKVILLIPSYLAYGERGAGGEIPPNSPLVFEVELVKIGN